MALCGQESTARMNGLAADRHIANRRPAKTLPNHLCGKANVLKRIGRVRLDQDAIFWHVLGQEIVKHDPPFRRLVFGSSAPSRHDNPADKTGAKQVYCWARCRRVGRAQNNCHIHRPHR